MRRVEELESQITFLSATEFQELRGWLAEYDAAIRDDQLVSDASAGRQDRLADQALKDFSEGRSTDL